MIVAAIDSARACFAILPGQYFDAETGLHQNWHRDYDPNIGRYLQSDPMGLASGLSTYGYAAQSPINFIDPTGLFHVGPPLPTQNTVICDGKGGFKVQIGGQNIRREPCLIECAEAHERQHIQDLQVVAPNVCKGQPYAHTVRPSNKEEKRRLEMNGYKVEIECLRNKLECGDCNEVAQERINQLESEREQYK
jgi:RHS repeat-associated protein